MASNTTPVVLQVDGFQDREVLKVDYKLSQTTDIEGQLNGIPRGCRVVIRVKALNDGNNELIQWMLNPNAAKDMKVCFSNTIDGSKMKDLEGTNCYCVRYVEKWEDGQMHFEEIEVVCQEFKNGSVTFENPWR